MDQGTKTLGIGLVDLDTSHPQAWLPILRQLGYSVTGVFDGGTVYPSDYASGFARRNDIPLVFSGVEAMAEHPDIGIAIVHSCNWDLHVGRAAPFVANGKAVLIDKPIAGRLEDLRKFDVWHRSGARISGGSSLRFAPEIRALQEQFKREGKPRMILIGCGVDEFNYGIHAYAMAAGMLGTGIESVRHFGIQHGMHRIELRWHDGISVILLIGGGTWLPFYATIVHAASVEHIQLADANKLYLALIEQVMPYLSGAVAMPPVAFDELIEPELAALAAQISLKRDGAWVSLNDPSLTQAHYDGESFGHSYRDAKRGAR